MTPWSFVSQDPEEMRAIGRALGQAVGAEGLVLALVGPLGAGKTVFVKGLAEGLGIEPRSVSSPTFVIAQEYAVPHGPAEATVLHHVDLYRLESEDELESIGFFDMFASGAVLAVEWADRFPGVLGRDVLRLDLEGPSAETERPRASRVSVEGEAGGLAARVGEDFRTRVDRLFASRADDERAATRPPADALLVWLAAGLIGLAAAGESIAREVDASDAAAFASCIEYAAAAGDRPDVWGTRRVARRTSAQSPAVSGVARLLVGATLDPNTARAEWLETLPGLGPTRAGAIVEARAHRGFASLRELERVPGIGPKTRARLARWLRVPGEPGTEDACDPAGDEAAKGASRS